jgi:predicted GTPase
MSNLENEKIRQDVLEIQNELQNALNALINEVGSKLKPNEREEIQEEFQQLNELLERLKTGLVWIALFGKTSVGKSAIANSLLDEAATRRTGVGPLWP